MYFLNTEILISSSPLWQPTSIVSYNHLGNNDGKNLSAPQQFRSKEISKSNVVDDMVLSNPLLYKPGEKPDHCVSDSRKKDNELHTDVYRKQLIRLNNCLCVLFQVVIKYVPYVGDSKRAMDEYTSEIMMGGTNTIALHNTCEVSVSVKCVTKNSKSSLFRAISNFLSVQTANCWLN